MFTCSIPVFSKKDPYKTLVLNYAVQYSQYDAKILF